MNIHASMEKYYYLGLKQQNQISKIRLKAASPACWLYSMRHCVFEAFLEGYVDQTGGLGSDE